MSSRKRYRPRPVAVNTFAIALSGATKPAKRDVDEILCVLNAAFKALREGVATETQWAILDACLQVSRAVERQGVVRGLGGHFDSAAEALQAIYNRASMSDRWHPTALHYYELDAMQTFVDLHAYQMRQLSRAEFQNAVELAVAQIRSSGQKVTLARNPDQLERLAA